MKTKKNRAAVALSRLCQKKLTAAERSEIARKGGKARMKSMTKAQRRAMAKLGGRPRKETEK